MNPTTLPAAALLGAGLTLATVLPGCAPGTSARLPHTTVPALEPVEVPRSSYAASGEDADGPADGSLPPADPAGGTFASGASAQPQFPPAGEQARLISLWGDEFVREAAAGALQLDGSSNIRQVSFATEGATFDPDVDRTGSRLVFASTRHRATADLYLQSTVGSTVTQLTSGPAHEIMPEFDPGGGRIAFASDRSGNWDIHVMPTSGGRAIQLTTDQEPELHPTWSPDGRHLAYCKFGSQTARWEIWVLDVENPSTPSFLTFGVFPQWSPDIASSKILFQRARERGSRFHSIWTIDYVGGEARNPTEIISAANAALINPAWSPDSRWIVFVAVVDPQASGEDRPAQSDVWATSLDGAQRVNLTSGQFGNYQPVWASTGSVYFVSNRSGLDNIWAVAATEALGSQLSGPGSVVSAEESASESAAQP